AKEGRRMRHTLAHEARQQLLCVKNRQLAALARPINVDALGFDAWAPRIPVGTRRHQDEALSVCQSGNTEPADRTTEKILILIQLHDVIRWSRVGQHSIPGRQHLRPRKLGLVLVMHRSYLRRGALLVSSPGVRILHPMSAVYGPLLLPRRQT